ncbi:hypothetical protein H0P26_17170 [Escherichia coli]|nr:hypothetical protein [Escherichia coli]
MKKSLLGLTFASLMFSAGSAVAADYKIDKEGQHAFVNFGNDSNLLIVFYVQIMPDDFVMQLHRF